MAPIQIGAIWVHDFHCFLFIPTAPRMLEGRQGRPKEAKTEALAEGRQE